MRVAESVLLIIPALLLAMPVFAQEPGRASVIWHDRGDVAALDLAGGPGGKDHEPGNAFRFIEESAGGTSPKFKVEDEHGIRWKVKLGEEAKSETAATRLLWAAGYLVDEVYYRPSIRVRRDFPRLARGREFVRQAISSRGASRARARTRKSTTWSWYDNPFVGTREFNGLRVMMALINNWDLKDVNNRAVSHASGGGGVRASPMSAPRSGALATSSPAARAYRRTTRRRRSSTEVDGGVRRLRLAEPALLSVGRSSSCLPLPDAHGEHRQRHSH